MKCARGLLLKLFGLWLILAFFVTSADAAAPANDNFADRIQFDGENVRLSGTFAGATLEPLEPTVFGTRSLWWSWKAPESGIALVHVIDVPHSWDAREVIVSTSTNVATVDSAESRVTTLPLSRKRYATFHATANTTYQVGLFANGTSSSTFNVEVGLATLPIILESSATKYVTPGQDALLTVATALVDGVGAQIQWRRNGSGISTDGPILALTNATPADAGNYDAVVSMDFSGAHLVKTTAVAQIIVTEASRPTLTITHNKAEGEVVVNVAGQPGRSYFLFRHFPETWSIALPATDFPFSFPPQGATLFYSVKVFEAVSPLCHLHLTRMRFATERIAADRKLRPAEKLTVADISQYLGHPMDCPSGGLLQSMSVDTYPVCSIWGHFLE